MKKPKLYARDFVALADELKSMPASYIHPAVIDALCSFCKSMNPAFNQLRFRAYLKGECGPRGGYVG